MNREMTGSKRIVWVAATAILFVVCSAWGKVVYVDDDATSLGGGTSWTTAYRFLQDALTDAEATEEPVEIWVGQGVYRPNRSSASPQNNWDRFASFAMLDDVAIRGGFAGLGFGDPNLRDCGLFPTVLSGDLAGDDAKVTSTQDLLGEPSRAENSYRVVRAECVDHTAVLEGCTITGAYSTGHGAGLYCSNSTPKIINCIFTANAVRESVGGLLAEQASPAVTNCTFVGNAGGEGGGLLATIGSAPVLTDCRFLSNVSFGGGAILCGGSISLRGCLIADCGSAVTLQSAVLKMVNCTLAGNVPAEEAVLSLGYGSIGEIRNCIFWNSGTEISGRDTSHLSIGFCDVRGGRSGIEMTDLRLDWEQGNIDTDPLFVSPAIGGFHLRGYQRYDLDLGWIRDTVASPCIDAGDPLDLVGYEPLPNGGRINMGAYGGTLLASPTYAEGVSCQAFPAGDINGDCKVDFQDFEAFASDWLEDSSRAAATGGDDELFPLSVGTSWTYVSGTEELTFRILGVEEIDGADYYRLNDYFNFGLGDSLLPNVGDEVLLRYAPDRKCLVMRLADGSESEVLCLPDVSVWNYHCLQNGGLGWHLVDRFWPADIPYARLVTTRLEQGPRDPTVTHLASGIGIVRYVCPISFREAGHHVFELKTHGASDVP